MTSPTGRVLVRMGAGDAEEAVRAASALRDRVGGFVVGADLLLDRGPILVGALCAFGRPVLADLGILDRPRAVARAVARMAKLGARWVSVPGLGGRAVVEAAVSEAQGYPETTVVVSAALAGWAGDDQLKGVGVSDTPGRLVARLTKLALGTGAGGILFPARELGVAVPLSAAEAGPEVAKTVGLSRMAEFFERLSCSEVVSTVSGGADWVVAAQDQVEELNEGT